MEEEGIGRRREEEEDGEKEGEEGKDHSVCPAKERKKGGGDGRGERTEWTGTFESSQGITALTQYAFEIRA